MVQFLNSLVCCPKGTLGGAGTVLGHGRCLGQLYQCPCTSAALSAVGAIKATEDPVGNYSLFPITGCTQSKAQPLHLGSRLNKVMVTSTRDQRSLPSDWGR